MQLVPYGRDHTNPPVKAEPQWTSPEVRALAVRACFDCHSNETKWPGYSNVAPVSWLVQHHVDEGRHELNFSEFDRPQKHAKDAEEELREGEMPMGGYVAMHAEAKLTDAEKKQLGDAFIAMFGSEKK
ncbi:MAG: heme-binding domain-containing protein [Archangium sp.]|nr:heme-binding domain-containing protein [Archangium sp.]